VDQLARVVDELGVDVLRLRPHLTDFAPVCSRVRTARRASADKVQVLQVEALCWCGAARDAERPTVTATW